MSEVTTHETSGQGGDCGHTTEDKLPKLYQGSHILFSSMQLGKGKVTGVDTAPWWAPGFVPLPN